MKRFYFGLLTSLTVFCLVTISFGQNNSVQSNKVAQRLKSTDFNVNRVKSSNIMSKLPRLFEQNIGQNDKNIKFISHGKDFNLFLTGNEATYQISDQNCGVTKSKEGVSRGSKSCQSNTLKMKLVGANQNPTIYGIDEAITKTSYFIGNDSSRWQTDISNYYGVYYQQIYDGIDFIYRSNEQNLEYDFRILPNVDPSVIQIEFNGAKKTLINKDGELVLEFKGGELRHKRPFAYQIVDGEKKKVEAEFIQLGKNRFGFKIGEYDKAKELIIDPITYLSYIGGSGTSVIADVVLDSLGNIYLLAEGLQNFTTPSNSAFIIPPSPTGLSDIFVTKLDPTATQVLFNAWIGGSSYDTPQEIDIDGNGNIVVGGLTESRNFPIILGRQTDFGGLPTQSHSQGFVFKMPTAGNSLAWSTYHGATDYAGKWDMGWVTGVDADLFGNVYVSGHTAGNTFPIVNGFQTTRTGNLYTGYLSKFDPNGQLVYSTYFGSTNPYVTNTSDFTDAYDVKADVQGNAYISGENGTVSLIPLTANPYKGFLTNPTTGQLRAGGTGFVAKFNTNEIGQNSLVYSTYTESNGLSITVDTEGNTFSLGHGTTARAGFGIKLNPTGTAALFSVPTTGHGIDCEFDAQGSIYFAEHIRERNANGVLQNKVLVRGYDSGGNQFGPQTIDGNSEDFFNGLAIGFNGSLWITGYTLSTDLPIQPGAIMPTRASTSYQGFLAKVILVPPVKTPLIFVPGIAGSMLRRADTKEIRWIPQGIPIANSPVFPARLFELAILNPAEVSAYPIEVPDVVRYDDTITEPYQVYFNLIQYLKDPNAGGYREYIVTTDNEKGALGDPAKRTLAGCTSAATDPPGNGPPNLFVFAYDWRKSVESNTAALKEYIACAKSFYSPGTKVNIVAHSMGGLLSRRYILENEGTHSVDKLITIGSPWLGAPRAIQSMETGSFLEGAFDFGQYKNFITARTMKELVNFFKGAHELLPSRGYFNLATNSPLSRTTLGLEETIYNYDQMKDFFTSQHPISKPVDTGDLFHSGFSGKQDDWRNDTTGVKYYHIYGKQNFLNTVGRVRIENLTICSPLEINCENITRYRPLPTEGDATVPLVSSRRIGNNVDLNYRANSFDDPFRFMIVPNPEQGETNDVADHNGMTSSERVQAQIVALLNGKKSGLPISVDTDTATPNDLGVYTTLTNIRDFAIRKTQPTSQKRPQPKSNDISFVNASFSQDRESTELVNLESSYLDGEVNLLPVGEKSIWIGMPTTKTRVIAFHSDGTPLEVEIVKGIGYENISQIIRYQDLALPENTLVELIVGPGGIQNIRIDTNGDEVVDTPINPSISVSGNLANDLNAPTLAFNTQILNGNQVVNILANDIESGLKQIRYSFDGHQFSPYAGPVLVTQNQGYKIYAFAEDNNGNRTGIASFDVNILDVVAPTTSLSLNPLANSSGWNNTDVGVSLSAMDNPSGTGVKDLAFSVTGSQTIPNTLVDGNIANFSINQEGTANIFYQSRDNFGNVEPSKSVTIRIDKTAPVTQGTYTVNGQAATITLTPNDNLSGVTGLVYSVDGGPAQNYQGTFNINGVGEHRVIFFATDAAGNLEAEKTLTYTIDPGPLTLSIIPMLQCVQANPNSTFTAIFGYQNNNPGSGTIPIGDLNKVTPAPLNQGQPTFFQVGGVYNAFTVTFNNGTITWHLTGPDGVERNAKANSKSIPCQ
jgi:pimeloyl-ACP methyl ester carboxylesterase